MPIQNTDFLVINRNGVDYKAPASDLNSIVNAYANDGKLTIKDSDGNILGEFTANQSGDTDVTIVGGSSTDTISWNDLTDKPDIGDGLLTINQGSTLLGTFTANQTTGSTISIPEGFSGSWNDLADKPLVFPPDNSQVAIALGDLTDVLAAGNTGDYLTKLADGSHGFSAPVVPPALTPQGYIDVAAAPPADPAHGDLYQQKSGAGNPSEVAIAGWTGIVGETAEEGQYVLFASDDQWHLSGNSTPTQVQSDWNETDSNSASYIQNKPEIGDGVLTINDSDGNSLGTFSANQTTSSSITLPSVSFNDLDDQPIIGDGTLVIKQGGSTLGSFSANQQTGSEINIAAPFSGNYDDLTNKPDLSNLDAGLEEAPDTGFVYTRNGKDEEWVRGIPYDISTLPPLS